MTYPDLSDRADDHTAPVAGILDLARELHAAGRHVRGLPRPAGLEPGGYYSVQRRTLRDGTHASYLAWRWREGNRLRAANLGRIDDASEHTATRAGIA